MSEILRLNFLLPALLRSFACAHYSIKRPKLTSSGIQTALRVKLERRKKSVRHFKTANVLEDS